VVQFNEPRHCRDPHFGQPPSNVELRERGLYAFREGERGRRASRAPKPKTKPSELETSRRE